MNGRFLAAMYLRLSREDRAGLENCAGRYTAGQVNERGAGSNSIHSQRELIKEFIRRQPDIELYDVYADDGFSGSHYDRPDFQRMIRDMEEGRFNCIIVKDLSRLGRDYIETGRYLQKIFPSFGVRFIALTDQYDSLRADRGESGIVLPVKNFINDSYCRDISVKVKSQLEVRQKRGECMMPFAVYGYEKETGQDGRKKLAADVCAAEVVRMIFDWKVEGTAVSAIAQKLNGLEILSPKEYKKYRGSHYRGGFYREERSCWSSGAVKRILTNEMYLGHLIQGKTEKINYKVRRSVEKPREQWVRVENAHEAIVSANTFWTVQRLLETDARISPVNGSGNPFSGLLFCRDCGEQMIRRSNRCKDTQRNYYICSTKNRGEGCSRHSVEEEGLRKAVTEILLCFANLFLEEKRMRESAGKAERHLGFLAYYPAERQRLKREQEKYEALCRGLDESLRTGICFAVWSGKFWSAKTGVWR